MRGTIIIRGIIIIIVRGIIIIIIREIISVDLPGRWWEPSWIWNQFQIPKTMNESKMNERNRKEKEWKGTINYLIKIKERWLMNWSNDKRVTTISFENILICIYWSISTELTPISSGRFFVIPQGYLCLQQHWSWRTELCSKTSHQVWRDESNGRSCSQQGQRDNQRPTYFWGSSSSTTILGFQHRTSKLHCHTCS